MLFHTWTFLIFFPIVFLGYLALKKTPLRIPWLLAASYVFYGWWNPYYLLLIVYSTALDYYVVAWMEACGPPGSKPSPDHGWGDLIKLKLSHASLNIAAWVGRLGFFGSVLLWFVGPLGSKAVCVLSGILCLTIMFAAARRSRKAWLWASMLNNLSLLFYFKYADFFIENANQLFTRMGMSMQWPEAATLMPFGWEYLLPVGISFYTFQSMSYTIDYYLGNLAREKNFLRFATYVAFFPQLVAGPIERASSLLPQFEAAPKIRLKDLSDGASLFLIGLFKKLALANYLSFYVERVYGMPDEYRGAALALATIAFAWQIYFDFSGYTDMARGIALMMGYKLMLNFNRPYLATSLGDFWSRWHISLSTWFRDYVYIPLGGNRNGPVKASLYLGITFLLSAIWHGAAWTFIVWGVLHALGTMITRELERKEWYHERVPIAVKRFLVFGFVTFAWIFFRAETMQDAWLIVTRIFSSAWSDPAMPALMLGLIALIWVYQWLQESNLRPWTETAWFKVAGSVFMLIWLCFFSSSGGAFIYFQF
jgi:D-alanyl-lipoteichoic acid acyltransferase DltB (MBOAT superfamily)